MDINELLQKNLIHEIGLSSLSEDEKNRLLEQAAEVILLSLVAKVEEELSDGKKEEFHRLLDTPDADAERIAFLKREIPDFERLLLKEILLLKAEILGAAAGLASVA